jgi:hypothetical protein
LKDLPGFGGIYSQLRAPPCSNREAARTVANKYSD